MTTFIEKNAGAEAAYTEALQLAWLIAGALRDAPSFGDAADRASHALDFAPLFDPTLWLQGRDRLAVDRELLATLAAVQTKIGPLIERRLSAEHSTRSHGATRR